MIPEWLWLIFIGFLAGLLVAWLTGWLRSPPRQALAEMVDEPFEPWMDDADQWDKALDEATRVIQFAFKNNLVVGPKGVDNLVSLIQALKEGEEHVG